MRRKVITRFATATAVVLSMVSMSSASFAAQGTGRVINYHLNGEVPGRGACVRTNPTLPGTGWGCIWYNDHLYKEYEALLLQAYVYGKTCTIRWSSTDVNGHGLVDLIECN